MVDLSSTSFFEYDATTANPIFQTGVGADPFVRPVDNFGLPQELQPKLNDGRIAFYLIPSDEWEGNTNSRDEILDEIYKNRCIELFMQALRLEDNKRFGRLNPPENPVFTSERNRNFYPYPTSEHVNNPNTPNDPNI